MISSRNLDSEPLIMQSSIALSLIAVLHCWLMFSLWPYKTHTSLHMLLPSHTALVPLILLYLPVGLFFCLC